MEEDNKVCKVLQEQARFTDLRFARLHGRLQWEVVQQSHGTLHTRQVQVSIQFIEL